VSETRKASVELVLLRAPLPPTIKMVSSLGGPGRLPTSSSIFACAKCQGRFESVGIGRSLPLQHASHLPENPPNATRQADADP